MCTLFKNTQLNYVNFMFSAMRNVKFYHKQYCGGVTSNGVSLLLLEIYRFPSSNLKSCVLLILIYCRCKPIYYFPYLIFFSFVSVLLSEIKNKYPFRRLGRTQFCVEFGIQEYVVLCAFRSINALHL